MAPIGNWAIPDREWMPDTSWTTPTPEAATLAELIHNLTQGISAAPRLEQLTQPVLDVTPVPNAESETAFVPDTPTAEAEGLEAAVLEQLDQLLAEPPGLTSEPQDHHDAWYLGIDIGTTGLSAVLLNQAQCRLYPLYWQSNDSERGAASRKQFRLPTAVTLSTTDSTASLLPTIRFGAAANLPRLSDWKPYLKVAVPHHSPQTSQWEPVLQWSDGQTVPLRLLQEVLQQLLATLNPNRASFMPSLTCGALGLDTEEVQAILGNLTGVVVGYPSNWSDTYSFNVREAILQVDLVEHPDQILFIEDTVATLLSALPAANGQLVTLSHQGQASQEYSGHLHNANWQGATLILTAGATLTELVLVNLPAQLQALNHTDFYVRSFPYAGSDIDQDIISHLLYPKWTEAVELKPEDAATVTPDFVLETLDFNELGLTTLALPAVADPDSAKRHALAQCLNRSVTGQRLLSAARSLKIGLQHQTGFMLKAGTRYLTIERQDLTSQVLLPYVQRLNRELNTLLAQTNTMAATVSQVICTGGTASLGAMVRWLRQKLPNATIIQDTYVRSGSDAENCLPSCSRVAYGLATLPLHPQVLDQARHQYSDYFLLKELLHALPQQSVHVDTVMQILEQRGINTQACRFRILALLEGHLPPGLVPAEPDFALLTAESAANPDYRAIQLRPLLTKRGDRTYEVNRPAWNYLQHYLDTLLADSDQTLKQPLNVTLMPLLNPSPQ